MRLPLGIRVLTFSFSLPIPSSLPPSPIPNKNNHNNNNQDLNYRNKRWHKETEYDATCRADPWYLLSSDEQVVDGIHQMFDVYSSHVVIVSVSSTSAALDCHQVVVPGITSTWLTLVKLTDATWLILQVTCLLTGTSLFRCTNQNQPGLVVELILTWVYCGLHGDTGSAEQRLGCRLQRWPMALQFSAHLKLKSC